MRLGFIEPLQFLPQPDDLTDNEDGWRLELCFRHILSRSPYGSHEHTLLRLRTPADHRSRRIRRTAVLDELLRDMRQIGHTHEEYQRIDAG